MTKINGRGPDHFFISGIGLIGCHDGDVKITFDDGTVVFALFREWWVMHILKRGTAKLWNFPSIDGGEICIKANVVKYEVVDR